MSNRALVVLEDLRRDEVEHARRALAQERLRHAEASAAEQAAARAEARCGRELSAARQAFASASTVFALRAAEAVLCVAGNGLARAVHRREHCQLVLREAERALALGQARLRSVEIARRAVERTLEQRAADVSLRTERRLEDESDDAFRGQFHGAPRPSGAHVTDSRAATHGTLTTSVGGARGGARTRSH